MTSPQRRTGESPGVSCSLLPENSGRSLWFEGLLSALGQVPASSPPGGVGSSGICQGRSKARLPRIVASSMESSMGRHGWVWDSPWM